MLLGACVARTFTEAVKRQQKVLKMLKHSSSRKVSWSSQKKSTSAWPAFRSCCRL